MAAPRAGTAGAARGLSKRKLIDPLAWEDPDNIPASIVKARNRIKESLTGTGLKDFVFFASPLIQDTRDNLSEEYPALNHLCFSVAKAARTLDDLNWDRFIELPVLRQHCMDYEMHTAFFAKIEPTWKTLLTHPKGSTTPCVWLHVGTQPTSAPLGDLLDKMGWFGVNIGPVSPPAHLREKVDHIQLDPCADLDDVNFKELCNKKGGMVPKPKFFKLAFIKLLFSPDDPILDSDEEDEEGQEGGNMGTIVEEPLPEAEADPSDPNATQTPKKKGLHDIGTEASGYGKIGVTRGMHVRRRLRALRNVLNVALSRLDNEGTLLITWPALPFHPMLFFLTHYLRGLFMRVHLVTPDSIKSWEVYILCAGFKRDDKDNPGAGGGNELKSFLDGAYRANCLDDVLLWTLTAEAEKTEAEGQKATLAVGYEELWTVFANKFEALAHDLFSEVLEEQQQPQQAKKPQLTPAQQAAAQQKAEQAKKVAGAKERAAQRRKEKEREKARSARSKADASPSPDRSKARGSKDDGVKGGAKHEPEEEINLEESDRKDEAEKNRKQKEDARKMNMDEKAHAAGLSKEEYEKAEQERLRAAVVDWKVMGNDGVLRYIPKDKLFTPQDKGNKKMSPGPPIQISRSYPTLSCSLGASAGSVHKGFPDREAFVAQFPLLAHALDCTEHKFRRWHRRRELLGTRVVPGGENGGLTLSEDLLRSIPGTPARPPSGSPSNPCRPASGSPAAKPGSPPTVRRAHSMPSPPRFKRMVPPPPILPLWTEQAARREARAASPKAARRGGLARSG